MMSHQNTETRWILGLVGVFATAIFGVVLVIVLQQVPPTLNNAVPTNENLDGVTILSNPTRLNPFTLMDTSGNAFSHEQLAGKPTLIAFGFTHCPDICPTTLNSFKFLHKNLGNLSNQVNFVFISVDGNRDTPPVLKRKLMQYQVDDFMIGLTDDPDRVREMGKPFGLEFIYGEADTNGDYDVEHTSSYFLLDANGFWVRKYAFGTDRTLIEADLRDLLK